MPPRRFIDCRTLEELQALTGRPVPEADRADLARVLETLPVRVTEHLAELMRRSPAVALQYLPDPREVRSTLGERHSFVGLVPTGTPGVERMYPDRCVIMPVPTCPAYCRFCFRKFLPGRAHGAPLDARELEAAVGYVGRHPELREVLITGGEPALDAGRLALLLDGLRRLSRVGPIRVACRALVTAPDLVDDELVELLARHQDLARGRPVELASHVNHPDELTPQTFEALARLRRAGIHVYNQTVLLRGVNTDGALLRELFWALRCRGVETYALFFGEPVLGMDHLRPSLGRARALKEELRRAASGRANPHLIVTTRIGKIELDVDGREVEREEDGRHVWLRTPYTADGMRSLARSLELPPGVREGPTGTLEVRYLDGAP